jgi:hypothetical protein
MPSSFRAAVVACATATVMTATTACTLSPPLHTVEIAQPGHGIVAVSAQMGGGLQGDGQLAYGVASHVQAETSGQVGAGPHYSMGAGLRAELPLTAPSEGGSLPLSVQVAGLFRHVGLSRQNFGCGHDSWISGGCLSGGNVDAGGGEIGFVGRVGSHGRPLRLGGWIGGAAGQLVEANGYTHQTVTQATFALSLEAALDDERTWNVLLGATYELMLTSLPYDNPEPSIYGVGVGIVFRP